MKTKTGEIMIDKFIDEMMDINDLPGLVLGYCIDGGSGYKQHVAARGFLDVSLKGSENEMRLKPDNVFHCASVSKVITATCIMKLVEEGRLNVYDRLSDVLPSFHMSDERWGEIRLWNMLTHTSGMGDVDDYHWDRPETGDDALRRYVYESPEVKDTPMLWDPQTAPGFYGGDENLFRYSNIAYEILGEVVEECSGMSFEDFAEEKVFRPAGMECTTMKTFERKEWADRTENMKHGDMAFPHEKKENRDICPAEYYPYTRSHAPSSTLTSTVGDLLKLGRAFLDSASGRDERILHRETFDTVWRDYATVPNNGEKMGLGWFMRKQKGYTLMGHEGTDDGFRASFWICPELQAVTVVLSNLSGAPVKKINRKLFDRITDTSSQGGGEDR